MQPDQSVIEFLETFAQKIIHRDFISAYHDLAPWLQADSSPETLEAEIDTEIRATLEACGESEACQPQEFATGWNSSTLDFLKEPRSYAPNRLINDQVTNENFKHWVYIQFQPSQDQSWEVDAFFDMWLMIVELETGLAVGYYEVLEPD